MKPRHTGCFILALSRRYLTPARVLWSSSAVSTQHLLLYSRHQDITAGCRAKLALLYESCAGLCAEARRLMAPASTYWPRSPTDEQLQCHELLPLARNGS
jgi:hypothetical protein